MPAAVGAPYGDHEVPRFEPCRFVTPCSKVRLRRAQAPQRPAWST